MEKNIHTILEIIDISYQTLQTHEIIVDRDIFLSNCKYDTIKPKIPALKEHLSSSFLTSLQNPFIKKLNIGEIIFYTLKNCFYIS